MISLLRRVLLTLCGSFASHPSEPGYVECRREAVMKAAAMVLVAVMAAVPGNAQTGTSLDCAKASNKVERTICGNVDLRDAERTVNAEFAALAGRLSGPAKEHTPPVGVPHDDQPARQTPRNQVPEQHWWCKSDFAVRRPAVDAIALAI